jgi:uncharacterized protein involved in tolerance to divalent cations
MADFVELVFGCNSWQQAHEISEHLLSKQLIARAEVMTAKEIKLLMTTATEHIESIESEIKELLRLEEITLHKVPLARFNHYTISGTEKSV